MDKLVTIADLSQFFLHTVILYKNRPSYVLRIGETGMFSILDLEKQTASVVRKLSFTNMSPPHRRIGMVNLENNVVYIKRVPMRRYQMGLTKGNISASLAGADKGLRPLVDVNDILRSKALCDAMYGRYPSLEEAFKYANEFGVARAFDKQFCVGPDGKIFYKLMVVGSMDTSNPRADKIKFSPPFSHLSLILGECNEENLRSAATTPL